MSKPIACAILALALLLGLEESGQAAGAYGASTGSFTIASSSPTTICVLKNTGTKAIKPDWITFSLTGGGSAQNVTVQLHLRTTLDTGTLNPATSVGYNNTITAQGVLGDYTTNPTPLGTGNPIRGISGGYGAAGSAFGMIWQFGTGRDGSPLPLPTLMPNQELAIDLGGVTQPTAAKGICDAEWTE